MARIVDADGDKADMRAGWYINTLEPRTRGENVMPKREGDD